MITLVCKNKNCKNEAYSTTFANCPECKKPLEQSNEPIKKEVQYEIFDIQALISFGYYARKNPNVVMRKNYLKWKKKI